MIVFGRLIHLMAMHAMVTHLHVHGEMVHPRILFQEQRHLHPVKIWLWVQNLMLVDKHEIYIVLCEKKYQPFFKHEKGHCPCAGFCHNSFSERRYADVSSESKGVRVSYSVVFGAVSAQWAFDLSEDDDLLPSKIRTLSIFFLIPINLPGSYF